MTTSSLQHGCPDCSGAVRPVVLFGRGDQNPISNAATDAALIHYADVDAQRGAWLGMYPIAGDIQALRCSDCGRIFLYGVPTSNEAATDSALDCLKCGAQMPPSNSTCSRCGWSY